MSPRKRWILLLSLLAGAVGLVLFSDPPKPHAGEVVSAAARPQRATPSAASVDAASVDRAMPATPMILAIRSRSADKALLDAFALQNWTPPPPPIPRALVPNKPTAPPLPFTVLGKKLDDEGWQVFLSRQDRTYVVHVDDVIDGIYRVDAIKPPTLTLIYIPMSERQSLSIGDEQ